jgi:tRNA threonylcarbamoyl adenosine modification protein YeaZ
MRTLAIETATEACSIALFEGSRLIAQDHRVLGRGHAEQLVPMIAGLPEKGQAEQILVSLGPGSFTGVRIGIATARALGFAWGAEVLGYPTLALIAAMAQETNAASSVTVCMNGGHGEWFVQNFAVGAQAEGDVQSLSPEAVIGAGIHALVAGNRAQALADRGGIDQVAMELLPDASKLSLLNKASFAPHLAPIYGRGPDAKLPSRADAQ